MKAIETFYKGFRFRSRLEARWAILFDTIGIPWIYEPEGFVLNNGAMYLPDFYLPDCKQFFEVKGIMTFKDMFKMKAFVDEANVCLTVGYDDFTFETSSLIYNSKADIMIWDFPECKQGSFLAKCQKCSKYYFIGDTGSYECPCCHYYDGNATFTTVAIGDDAIEFSYGDFKKAMLNARQARFEYGENK